MLQGLVVLPSLRLNRLREDIDSIVGDREYTERIMEAIEHHLEQGAHRWGNACPEPECGALLTWSTETGWRCPEHGHLGRLAATRLLVSFDPVTSTRSL